jgi:NAD(P)-dependent dehydrogenase (short-subunit alcohol dehydrogenase family)
MRAIITGAASGMGKAIAERFAADAERRETSLVLVDLSAERLASVQAELAGAKARIATVQGDLSDPIFSDRIIAVAKDHMGGLDALISNAGIAAPSSLVDLTLDAFNLDIAVNARATWLLGKAGYPLLKESKGCVVATASLAAQQVAPYLGAYSASKAALVMLVRQMAYEWGKDGIRCNCISPGRVMTALNKQVIKQEASTTEDVLALGRAGDPSEIASVVAFLTSSESSYITGANIMVDGGMEVSLMAALRREGP